MEMFTPLIVYAQGVLANHALAEEAVQDAFRIACVKIEDMERSQNPQGWLTNVLKYVICNQKKGSAYMTNLLLTLAHDSSWQPEGRWDEIDPDILYADLLENEDYQLLKKFVLEERTILELSEELGISTNACKKRVERAKKTLRKRLLRG